MGTLSEIEIFSCLIANFRLAAEHCDDLAKLPAKGPTYHKLREELRLIEGAARQAAFWREDARWLPIGQKAAEIHKHAGEWLRGYTVGGIRVRIAAGEQNPLFRALAELLRAFQKIAEDTRTKATGHLGIILPKPLPAPHRDTRPSGWGRSAGGVILPATMQ